MIEFPMPEVTQGSDQNAILTIAEIVYPGFIESNPDRGLVMQVEGDVQADDLDAAEERALAQFAAVLGVLRAFKHGRGELAAEVARQTARDEHGNQTVRLGTARAYVMFPGALESFAGSASAGLRESDRFPEALWLFGQPNRDGGTFYSIHEYARAEFGGPEGVSTALSLSVSRQSEFTKSANQMKPADGGRHAKGTPDLATMDLEGLSEFATDLMAAWIRTYQS